ncbi:arylamine n-acetyltransferase 1 [Moniliophthora roreri MCA 2997]|uniref:Tpa: arylamine n-acetyltransferase 1 n=2 Tax=Moniliophthora roreri TaxID=221103 RepID=V2WH22_MONRO|nr:arylamine n-acetyltransferase 1 [Moniliophthora roreri MCA 2997]KAI3605480.1 arylamine n-acetyltransferase 1 [Moniliophthora roreri]
MTSTLSSGAFVEPQASPCTKAQVLAWLDFIQFPVDDTIKTSIENDQFGATLKNLTTLNRLYLVKVPFESTLIHYSANHRINVEPDALFQRIVVEKAGGSYCFGKTSLFLWMLRGLGYRAYAGLARVNSAQIPNEAPTFSPLVHLVLFVQPIPGSNETYLVDPGFGGAGLTRPILLSSSESNVVEGTTSTELHRLRKIKHPRSSLNTPATDWALQVARRKADDANFEQWKTLYMFGETEYFLEDFILSSFYCSVHPYGSPFESTVALIKYFWLSSSEVVAAGVIPANDEEEYERRDVSSRMLGYYTLYGDMVKKHIGGKTEVVKVLVSEEERVKLIRELFGVALDEDAINNIRGRNSAFKLSLTPSGEA